MKLSVNWLKDYVDPKLSVDELIHRLTMAGLEVEEAHQIGTDTVLDLEITPNRPDCLCTLGLAREIAAITSKNLKLPKIPVYKGTKKNRFTISIQDKKDCPQYSATYFEHASISAAPGLIKERLTAVGINAINNAVDITNFVLMEMGQPLHVFDADKIQGQTIIVRRAKQGESMVTLDGIERKLNPEILVIADAKGPIAIAGIMGGLTTSVTAGTKNILLESAQFDMGIVRRAGRSLGLKSDSSYRFERGIDAARVLAAANRATDLLIQITKARFIAQTYSSSVKKTKGHSIQLTVAHINELLGTVVKAPAVAASLKRLGLGVSASSGGRFKITVSSFRGDLKQEVDIIEEVARIIGYDRLDVSFPNIQVHNIVPNSRPRETKKFIAKQLQAQGVNEVITFSLINAKDLERSNLGHLKGIELVNALSAQHNLLRPSLIPSLLSVALTNINRGQKELRLFELGKIYGLGTEKDCLGILFTGKRFADWRHHTKDALSFVDLKGVLEKAFASIEFQYDKHPGLDEARAATILLNGKTIGFAGAIDKKVLNQWDIKAADVYLAQIELDSFYAQAKIQVKYQPISDFPAMTRDVSIAVKKDVSYAAIKESCLRLGGTILKEMNLIEEYTGDKIQSGYRGLVFSLVYQSQERTLRDDEVNAAHQNILKNLMHDYGAIQR